MSTEHRELRMVFDAPPGRDMPTLVEIEDQSGRAIDIGEWRARPTATGSVIPIRQGRVTPRLDALRRIPGKP